MVGILDLGIMESGANLLLYQKSTMNGSMTNGLQKNSNLESEGKQVMIW